jgi:phosphoribosyl 1,2-cyclic phosphodiesterase
VKIRFWGVRGSIPCPGPQTVKYGGNTLCLEMRFKDPDRLIIIDAGSGIRRLGNHLIRANDNGRTFKADLFLTHTHLDHILGFPFFSPVYAGNTHLKIYGPVTSEDESLEVVMGRQLSYHYFPVRQRELPADIEYINLKEGCFDLGDGIMLTTKYLNHPLLCFGYRFEYQRKVLCTAYDTEPFHNIFSVDPQDPSYDEAMAKEGALAAAAENRRIQDFIKGADVLIHDAQFTRQEYESGKKGWGHTSVEDAIRTAKRAGVRILALLHHDPMRTDSQLDDLAEKYCNPHHDGDPEIFFAREGMEVKI